MYASTSLSDTGLTEKAAGHQRVSAAAAVSFKNDRARTVLDRLYQQGSAKVRFPKNHGTELEAVLINTAGGLTGGDRLSWDLRLSENARVVASTQACEKAYGSSGGTARLETQIRLDAGSTLHWLPQETILYENSALNRTFDVTMSEGATLLAMECLVIGREAMGETVTTCTFTDRWRIRRGEKLVFADEVRLAGQDETVATMRKRSAVASLLCIGMFDDEQTQPIIQMLRKACPIDTAGFSGFNGKITGRILAPDSYKLRQALVPVLRCLRGTELPRVWRI